MTFTPDFYNEGWHHWDDMKVYGATARHTRRFIFSLLNGVRFETVLDAGCGTGILLQQISEAYPKTILTGSEYSSEGIEFAKKRLPDADFHVLDLSKDSLHRTFDLITCIDVIEHIPDDRTALKNLRSMTGGHLVVSVPLGKLFKVEEERMGHVHGYTRKEFEEKLREAGFEIVKAIHWGFPFYNLHRRFVNAMPAETSAGTYGPRKKLLANVIYTLFYLNLPFAGERYYALCRPARTGKS